MMKKTLVLLTMLFVGISCEHFADQKRSIRIRNNSSEYISAYGAYILPDTTLAASKPEKLINVPPGSFKDIYGHYVGDPPLERFGKERLTIFILSTEVVNNYPWDSIRDNYMVLKRFEILEKDLGDNGSISYP